MNTALKRLVDSDASWRFPQLAVHVERDPDAPVADLVRTLAADIAAALSPDDAIELVLETGALNRADRMVDGLVNDGCSAPWAEAAYEEIDRREARRREHYERERRAIAVWCHRAGVPRPNELDQPLDYRREDGLFLENFMTLLREEVSGAQAARSVVLRERLAATEISEIHRQDIERLIDCGELRLAESALKRGDARILTIPGLSDRPWLDTSETLEVIVKRLEDPRQRPPSYAPFVPLESDTHGKALITALRGVVDGTPNCEYEFVTAVQSLIANWTAQLTREDGRTFASLYLPEVGRLPALRFQRGRNAVKFAVGPEPADAPYRLSLEVSDSRPGVVDIAALLSLLARVDGSTREREDRLALFYRAVCRQLPVRDLVDAISFAEDDADVLRLRVWWLFYLVGYQITPEQVDGFMDITGGIPEVIVTLADLVVESARTDYGDISIAGLRENDELSDRVIPAVSTDIGDESAELLLYLVLNGADNLESASQMFQRHLSACDPPVDVHARYIVDLPEARDVAAAKGYLVRKDQGFTPRPIGGLFLLPKEDIAARLGTLTDRMVARFRADRRMVANARAQEDLHEKALHALTTVETAFLQGSEPHTANVRRCCETAFKHASEAHQRVRFADSIDVEPGADVAIDGVLLWSAVLNLLNNAAQSALARADAGVHFSVKVDGEAVRISVSDSGPGFREDILDQFRQGAQAPSSKGPRRGSGLESARVTAGELGGSFTVDTASEGPLGGAVVSLVFPLRLPEN